MELTAESIMPSFPASNSSPTENQTSAKSIFKGKRKMKKKDTSKINHEAPDLDIVSGFAFLSFSNIADLEYHIEQTEAKSYSLSINVGAKRKIRSKTDEKDEISEVVRSTSKRVRVPSQKILESYATKGVPITELVSGYGTKPGKLKQSPQEKELSSYLHYTKDHSSELSNNSFGTNSKTNLTSSDISLECSESINVCVFDDEECKPMPSYGISTNTEIVRVKKPKKKKRSADISDTSCQTKFRIKKKKKKHQSTDLESSNKPISSSATVELCDTDSITTVSQENSLSEFPDSGIIVQNIDTPSVYVHEEDFESPRERYKQMQATKFFDSKQHRPKLSNKVEKIDYCARSGGLELVGKHHERQSRKREMSDLDSLEEADSDIQDNDNYCDVSIHSDHSSSSNEFNADAPPNNQEGLLCNKSRIFAGSSSIFMSGEESQDDPDVDIDDGIDEPIPSDVNIVKALPGNYLFGHFSTYPDKSTEGTIDVSLQIYENDIQLYMNYASDFNGRIIKIITPDNEENKNTNCLPNPNSQSGLPKFLQPREYVKAVRSATERNRRHNLGDLFNHLKKEIFGDITEYYFSKQAILTKALEVISNTDQEYYELSKERAKLSAKNQLLRKSLNGLLFGDTKECEKKVDVNKVTDCLKTMGIEIEMPESSKEDNKAENKESKESSNTPKSNVTKKGRPPVPGKLFKKIEISEPGKKDDKPAKYESQVMDNTKGLSIPPAKLLKDINQATTTKAKPMPNTVLIDANMKTFVTIAPKEPQSGIKEETVDIEEAKEQPADFTPVDKIVCNISRYRLETIGEKSGMTMVTKQAEPFKSIASNNVVHIKISNDVMKQINNTDNAKKNSALTKDYDTTTKGKLVELSELSSVSFANQSSFSTQTDFDTVPPCTDYNSNSIKSSQKLPIPSTQTAGIEQSKDETTEAVADISVAATATTTTPVSTTSKPLVLKASDSLKKLVNILRERALTKTSMTQDLSSNQYSTSTFCTSADTQCSPLCTVINALPQVVQGSPAGSSVSTASHPILSTEVSKGTVTMTTVAQISKVNSNQTLMKNAKSFAMTTSQIASLTTPVNVSMATPKHIVTTSGHVTMSIPDFVTAAKPIVMATMPASVQPSSAIPKSVAVTTAAQFPITTVHTSVLPSLNPVTTVTPGVKQQKPVAQNVIKQPSVIPQTSKQPVLKGGVNIMPNNPIRIVFKPSGKMTVGTPVGQVQGTLQSQRVLRLPLGTTLSSNVLQAPNIKLLLQKNNPVMQQSANSPIQSSVTHKPHTRPLAPRAPQVVYSKPLVKIQPLPQSFQSPTNLQHGQTPSTSSCPRNGKSMPTQPSLVVTTSSTSLNLGPSTSSELPSPTFTNQSLLINTGSPTGSSLNQAVFSPVSSSNSISLQKPVSPLLPQQQNQPIIIHKPVSTSVSSKTLFTGMEQVVAKIPSITPIPQQTVPLQRKYRELLPSPMNTTANLQGLGHDILVTTSVSSHPPQVIVSSSAQPSTTLSSNVQGSLNTADVNQAKMSFLMSDKMRASFANTNPRSVASQPSEPCSSICNSVTFQHTEPRHDKTCSVVERTVDNSNVVTADKLSVWNIDSSIPDIKSELQGDKPLTGGLFNNSQNA